MTAAQRFRHIAFVAHENTPTRQVRLDMLMVSESGVMIEARNRDRSSECRVLTTWSHLTTIARSVL